MTRAAFSIFALIWALVLLPALAVAQSKYLAQTGTVVDAADILTVEEKAEITAFLETHVKDADQRVVVVSVESLGNMSIERYAFELAQLWQIETWPGEARAILLIADNERQVRIEFGPPVRGTMIDVRSSQMVQRVILPAFRAGQFDIGIRAGLGELFTMLDTGVAQASDEVRYLSDFIFDKRMLLPLALLLVLIAICVKGHSPCGRRRT